MTDSITRGLCFQTAVFQADRGMYITDSITPEWGRPGLQIHQEIRNRCRSINR